MSDDEGFLAQLREHPEDDTTRLVYADWLEERDDPRGAYLRGEVELASLDEGTEQWGQVRQRLCDQRATVDPDWLARVGKRFDVVLVDYDVVKKIAVIMAIRELTGCGLAEGKAISESLPACVVHDTPLANAELAMECLTRPLLVRVSLRGTKVGSSEPGVVPAYPLPICVYALRLVSFEPGRRRAVIRAVANLRGESVVRARELVDGPLPVPVQTFRGASLAHNAAVAFHPIACVEISAVPPPYEVWLRGLSSDNSAVVNHAIRWVTHLGRQEAASLATGPLPARLFTTDQVIQITFAEHLFRGIGTIEVRQPASS